MPSSSTWGDPSTTTPTTSPRWSGRWTSCGPNRVGTRWTGGRSAASTTPCARQGGSLRTALATDLLGDAGLRAELHERTRRHWTHPPGTLYPDVLPLLRALVGRVAIGVLANQEAGVVDALTRDGVAPFVDVWGVSALVGYEKPSRELFAWCLEQAGCGPGQAVHVGNRLDTDVRPAAALGLGTVWVLRGEAPDNPTAEQLAEPDLAVPDLTGLADVLLPLTLPAGRGAR